MPINADNGQNNNNDDQNEQQSQANNPVTMAGSGKAQPSSSGRVAGFSSGQPQQAGSGRFTNLSKYMSANQGAGERIGSQIQGQVNRNVDTKTSNISEQNQKVRQGIDQGRAQLNQGNQFNEQLGNINKGLSSFNNMEDRAGFDAANQQAQQFAQAPNFNQFQNIQAGQGVDEDMLNQGQGQAQVAGQDLSKFTGDNISRIGTEQGRYELLKNRFAPAGRSYAAGNARLDQALLQNAPGNVVGQMRNQFVNQNQASSALNNAIGLQGQDVSKTVADEVSLLSNLDTVTKSNQDIFNEKLGQKGNIDFINKLREDKYNEYVNQLKSGNIGQDLSQQLGLSSLNTYVPGQAGTVGTGPVARSAGMSADAVRAARAAGQEPGFPVSVDPRQIVGYNTNLAQNAENYLKRGQSAQNMQDITTDDDFAAYQALANIAKRDTGKLSGASQLDKAVQAKANSEGRNLSDVIAQSDKAFRDAFAGKNFSSYAMGRTGADDKGNFLENSFNSAVNSITRAPQNLVDGLRGVLRGSSEEFLSAVGNQLTDVGNISTGGTGGAAIDDLKLNNLSNSAAIQNLVQNDTGSMFNEFTAANNRDQGGQGTGAAFTNIDDYIKSGDAAVTAGASKTGRNLGTSAANSRQAVDNARAAARSGLTSGLDEIIKTTGVKNQLNINQDDSQNATLQRAKRFGRLV